MNNAWKLMLLLLLAAPVFAQEEPAEEPVTDEAATDAAPAEEAPPEAAPAESIETTPVEEASAEPEQLDTVPVEEEAAAEEEGDALRLYAGVDFASTTLSVSNLPGFATGEYDSGLYRLRAGVEWVEQVMIELQFGFDAGDEGPGEASTKNYYGLFVVPTANLFDVAELAFPVGYAQNKVERPNASESLGSLAYGLNAELPLRNFGEGWPDLRIGGGWMVYYQKSDARLYGWNAGIRYDFTTSGFGNPFAGWDLWPFGDDEEQPEGGE